MRPLRMLLVGVVVATTMLAMAAAPAWADLDEDFTWESTYTSPLDDWDPSRPFDTPADDGAVSGSTTPATPDVDPGSAPATRYPTPSSVDSPTPQQIDDARDALQRVQQSGHAPGAMGPHVPAGSVVLPEEPVMIIGGGTPWGPLGGSGALVLISGLLLVGVVAELIRGVLWRPATRGAGTDVSPG